MNLDQNVGFHQCTLLYSRVLVVKVLYFSNFYVLVRDSAKHNDNP